MARLNGTTLVAPRHWCGMSVASSLLSPLLIPSSVAVRSFLSPFAPSCHRLVLLSLLILSRRRSILRCPLLPQFDLSWTHPFGDHWLELFGIPNQDGSVSFEIDPDENEAQDCEPR
jgi:hypothetical protein